MHEEINLSQNYYVEHFRLANHHYNNTEISVTLVKNDEGFEAEYEIIFPDDIVDGFLGQFNSREAALKSAEEYIYIFLRLYKRKKQ